MSDLSGDAAKPSVAERLLAVDDLGDDVFATSILPRRNLPRLYGGQVAAQALLAALRTVDTGRNVHSLHAYFIRMGQPEVPISYRVDRTRDGRAFATRHVTASQGSKVILELMASFQDPEIGADWQQNAGPLPPVPVEGPQPHPRIAHLRTHLDMRMIQQPVPGSWRIYPAWFRTHPPIGDDAALNAAMLTYVSDMGLMADAREPGTSRPMCMAASLDHAIWFHRPPRVDDWLFFRTEPVANIGTRGIVRGTMHDPAGLLIASITQEALLRPSRS